jgi:ribosomal protein S3
MNDLIGVYQVIEQVLKDWKAESGATQPILYRHSYIDGEIIICTPQPGWLIGKGGCLLDKYLAILKGKHRRDVSIKFVETSYNVI